MNYWDVVIGRIKPPNWRFQQLELRWSNRQKKLLDASIWIRMERCYGCATCVETWLLKRLFYSLEHTKLYTG